VSKIEEYDSSVLSIERAGLEREELPPEKGGIKIPPDPPPPKRLHSKERKNIVRMREKIIAGRVLDFRLFLLCLRLLGFMKIHPLEYNFLKHNFRCPYVK
jgi:hypothetical protein